MNLILIFLWTQFLQSSIHNSSISVSGAPPNEKWSGKNINEDSNTNGSIDNNDNNNILVDEPKKSFQEKFKKPPLLLRALSTQSLSPKNSLEYEIPELEIIVFRIDNDDMIRLWTGKVDHKDGYRDPTTGENIISYWREYELEQVVLTYLRVKSSRDNERLIRQVGEQHYMWYFFPNSHKSEKYISGYILDVGIFHSSISSAQQRYEDAQILQAALSSHQTRFQCYNILLCLQGIQDTIPMLRKTRLQNILDQEGKILSHNELCNDICTETASAFDFTSTLLKRQQQFEDIIAFQQDSMLLEPKTFDVIDSIKSIWKDNFAKAKKKDLRFVLQVEPLCESRLPIVIQDEFRFRQLCQMLIDNAITYTESGGVLLYLGLDMQNIVVNVIDSGPGIEEEMLQVYLSRLQIGKLSLSQQPKASSGLGVSIAIAHHIVQLMSGTIQITSSATDQSSTGDENGSTKESNNNNNNNNNNNCNSNSNSESNLADSTTFSNLDKSFHSSFERSVGTHISITLPCHYQSVCAFQCEDPDLLEVSKLTVRDKLNKKQKRFKIDAKELVLVVDDDPIIHKLWKRYMKDANLQIEHCYNGEEAVKFYESSHTKIAIIFMDIQMPVLDGLDATMAIRKFESRLDLPIRIGIIANTASGASDGLRKKCSQVGMNNFLQKPNQRKEINRMIDKYATFYSKN